MPIALSNLLKMHSSILSFHQMKLLPMYYLLSVNTQSLKHWADSPASLWEKTNPPASLLHSIWHRNLLSLVMVTDLDLEIWLRLSHSHSLSKASHLPKTQESPGSCLFFSPILFVNACVCFAICDDIALTPSNVSS